MLKKMLREADGLVLLSICGLMLLLPVVIGDYNEAKNDLRHHQQEATQKGAIEYASTRP
jgi:hypothetical protein